ncbi:MAG: HDOD domain-containing protein [Methylococcales bacterium]
MQLTVNTNTPEALVSNVVHLISLPNVYTQLEKTLKDPKHTRDDIAEVISIDPSLCARTLRIINSSYYALPNTVYSISTAVNLIGEYDLRNIVLVNSAVNSVSALIDDGINITEFWQHSIRCGITAKLLAKLVSESDPELLFLTGLLHDLGQLIIYKNEPELSATIAWQVINENQERYQIEQALLGFDHATIGALLLENWGVPKQVSEIIKFHHQPTDSSIYNKQAKLVGLADQLAHLIEPTPDLAEIDFDQLPTLIMNYLDDLKISKSILFDLLIEVIEQSQAIEEIICTV